jgi:hypothetical protein
VAGEMGPKERTREIKMCSKAQKQSQWKSKNPLQNTARSQELYPAFISYKRNI